MPQSNLWRKGGGDSVAAEITSDDARDLGDVDVKKLLDNKVDITSDGARTLGEAQITNTVAVNIATQASPLGTDIGAIISGGALPVTFPSPQQVVAGANIPVEQQTPVKVEDSVGSTVDPATEGTLTDVDAKLGGTLAVEQQTPVQLEDTGGTGVDPATESTLAAIDSKLGGTLQTTGTANSSGVNFGVDTVSTPGTPVALNGGTSQAIPDGQSILLQANVATDGNKVYVGDGTVDAASGYPLVDGQTLSLQVADVNDISIDADAGGDGVNWIVEA